MGAVANTGNLVVYTATYPSTLEQSEYPVHTGYTIATMDGRRIEWVANATGTFNSNPAEVNLPAGEYRIRAQYDGGAFVDFAVDIEAGKTTTVDLEAQPLHTAADSTREPIRLPGGRLVGWQADHAPRN